MAWLYWRRRMWQAAQSPGDPHAGIEPGISECDLAMESERIANAVN